MTPNVPFRNDNNVFGHAEAQHVSINHVRDFATASAIRHYDHHVQITSLCHLPARGGTEEVNSQRMACVHYPLHEVIHFSSIRCHGPSRILRE